MSGRHAHPDSSTFWRSLLRAVASGIVALGLTVGLVVLLVNLGTGGQLFLLPSDEAPEDISDGVNADTEPVDVDADGGADGEDAADDPGPADRAADPDTGAGRPGGEGDDDAATDGPSEDGEPDTDVGADLIDGGPLIDAREPEEVTVQVLDGANDRARTDAAVAALREMGYRVVAVNPALARPETTVMWTSPYEADALALVHADERFGVVEENPNLSMDVDLHVVVGADWPG